MKILRFLYHTMFGHPSLICSCGRLVVMEEEVQDRSVFRNRDGKVEPHTSKKFRYIPIEPGSVHDPFTILQKTDLESLMLQLDYHLYHGRVSEARTSLNLLYRVVRIQLAERTEERT